MITIPRRTPALIFSNHVVAKLAALDAATVKRGLRRLAGSRSPRSTAETAARSIRDDDALATWEDAEWR
jgi:hypothetical protein